MDLSKRRKIERKRGERLSCIHQERGERRGMLGVGLISRELIGKKRKRKLEGEETVERES